MIEAGIIASNDKINASIIQRALSESSLNAEKQKEILTSLGLINAQTGEVISTNACSKAALEEVLAKKGIVGSDAEAIIASIGLTSANSTQAISFKLLTASIWANIKALGAWLVTNPVGWIIISCTAILGLTKAYDTLTGSVKRQKEKMEESSSAYKEAKNNLSSITTELEVQQKELDDLTTKNRALTNEEQGRLAELQKITKELRIQKDLAEKEEDRTQQELAEDASTLFKKQFGKKDISEDSINKYLAEINASYGNSNSSMLNDPISFMLSKQDDISAMIAMFEESNRLLNEAYSSKNQNDIDKYTGYVDKLKEETFSIAQELQNEKDNMSDFYNDQKNIPYDNLDSYTKEILNNYNNIDNAIELIYKHLDPTAWKSMQIENVFDTDGIEKTKEELIELTKAGELDESTLLSYSKLSDALKDNKLSAGELLQELNDLAQAEMEVQSSETSVEPYQLSIDDAKKAVNGFKEGDTEVIGLIEEYELLQEVLSDTGNIQEETYEKLLSCSSKYATAIRTENGRITVNTSKLKAVAKSRQLDTKEAIRQTLALKKQEWVQWNQGIENYNGTLLDNIQNTYGNIDALQQQITQYELLVNSVDEASNAFKRFEAAQSVDEQDMFTTAQNAFDLVNETLNKADSENYGKTNSKKFQYGMELLADDKDYEKLLNAESMEDYVRISKEIVKTLSPLFTENEGLGVDNLFKRADAIVDSGDIPKNDKEWADKLNTSVEMFQALKQRANLYEYNNREYFSSGFTNKLDEYQSRLSNVQSAQEALNECTDTTSNEYKRLSKELDDAKQKYNEFKNETADTVEDAYTGFIHSDAKSKGSFSDYLKQSMGMEDSDITGMIDVLLNKSKSLQENLSNMHPDSTAYELYKKQLDDVNSLIASLDFDIDSIDKTKSLEDKISQYKELAKEAEEYKKTLETEDSGSESYKEAAQELERISVLMNELRDPLRLEVNSNISEIESQISQLDEKLKGLNESLKHASGSNEAYAIHMDIKGAENEKSKLEGQKSDLEKKLKIIVDDTEAAEKTEAIQNEKIDDKNFEVNVTDNATSALHKIENIKLSDKSLNVNVKVNDPAGINITGSGAFGSAQNTKPKQANADGTFHAFAQGTGSDVSIAKDEKALVNELGEEGIVRNGKLIPVKGGAQFINLKRGDIIFNH